MTGAWASLQEAAETVRASGLEDPMEVIRQAVSAALIVRPGTLPLPGRTPPAPRLRVISQRTTVGMDWLEAPVLDFEKSEILCRSFMARTQEEFSPRELHPARIELWSDDLLRLWPPAGIRGSREESAAAPVSGFLTNKQEALQIECVAWLQGLPPTPAMTKATAKEAAMKAVPGLSGRQFDRAWDRAAPAAWKQPGRKATA